MVDNCPLRKIFHFELSVPLTGKKKKINKEEAPLMCTCGSVAAAAAAGSTSGQQFLIKSKCNNPELCGCHC